MLLLVFTLYHPINTTFMSEGLFQTVLQRAAWVYGGNVSVVACSYGGKTQELAVASRHAVQGHQHCDGHIPAFKVYQPDTQQHKRRARMLLWHAAMMARRRSWLYLGGTLSSIISVMMVMRLGTWFFGGRALMFQVLPMLIE